MCAIARVCGRSTPFYAYADSCICKLTRPNLRRLRSIGGDGNCLFRALSYIITGSENLHQTIRSLIVSHMLSVSHLLIGYGPDGRANYANGMQNHNSIDGVHIENWNE